MDVSLLSISTLRCALKTTILSFSLGCVCLIASAQFTITQDFKGNSQGNITLGGAAKLTSGTIDPAGQGWLRLTEDTTNQVGYAFVNQGFPSTLGVLMDFEYISWRRKVTAGADGFSVFLFDDVVNSTTFSLGSRGGSLGYAQSTSTGNTGLRGGYIGVGIDEYGNYSNCSEGKSGGQSANCGTLYPNFISARGPGPNYSYLSGVNVGTSLDYDNTTVLTARPTPTQFYRRVQVILQPNGLGQFVLTVKSTTTPGGTLTTLFGPLTLTSPPPARLKLGFAASTGGSINKHEVRNLIITTPGNIRTQKLVNKTVAKVGDQLVYTVNVYNETTSAVNNLPLTDIFSPNNGFNITNVAFSGTTGNTATGYNSTSLSTASLNMVANSVSTFTVTGTVASKPANGMLTNTAYVDPTPTGISDGDPTNDTSSVSTQIIAPDLNIAKTHTGNLRKGLSGTYTLNVNNVGVDAKPGVSTVTVTDIVPAGMTAGAPSGTGWAFSGTGNNITAIRSDVLAPGAAYPPISIPVTVASNAPDSITNTATVTNEFDANTANNTAKDPVDTRRNMDLQVVSLIMPPGKLGCLNVPYQVQVNIRNNGPDSAVNGRLNFSVPTALNNISLVSRTITSGGGRFGTGSSVSTTGYVDSVTLSSGATARYIFAVTVTSPAPAMLAIAQASLLRSGTDLDIDASDPALAIPTDPLHECDAAPSGGGCNNILRDTTFVSGGVSQSNAGPDQVLCGATTTTLAATAPVSGTGNWQQASGPNTATINNVAVANTGISNLIPGIYAFVWTVSNGGCTPSSDTVQITVNALPTLAVAGPDQSPCNVTSATLAGNTPVTGTGGWRQISGPNNATFADTTNPTTGISGLVSGSYTFVWTIRNANCTPSMDTVVINVSPSPTTANAGPDQQLCNATSTPLAGNTPTAGTGQWSQIAGPNTASFANATQSNTVVQNLQPGTYSLVWTISSGSCAPSADTMQLIIAAAPTSANAGPDQTKYNNGQFTISGNTPASGSGSWTVVSSNAVIGSPSSPTTTATLQPNTTATLTWTITNGNCPPSIDTVVLTYTSQADLKVTKSDAGNTYKTNSTLTYTITIENAGPSDIYGFTLKDTLPALMTGASWTSVVTGTNVALRPLSGAGNIIAANGDIPFAAGNKIVITVTGTVAANAIGGNVITNTATVSNPTGLPDPVPGNNSSTVTGTVPNNPPIAVNDNYTTIRDVPVSGNVLTNDSDPENQPITVSPTLIQSPASGSVVQNTDGTFTYTPAPGFVGTDTYIYQVCDNQGACSQATVTITVTKGMAHLTIAKIATPATASAGGPLTYTLTVTNNGPSTILSTETFSVVDTLPAGFIASTFTPSAGTYNNGNWTGVTLKPGASVTLTIAGTVASSFTGTSLTNTASATPPPAIPDSTPATTTLVTPVTKSVEVVVTKTDNTTTYVPGTTTQYKITVVNNGPADLVGATFQDPLPAGITTASWTAVTPHGGQANNSGNGPINEIISLPAGSTVVYTLTITIPSNYTGPLTNTASVVIPSGYNNINPSGNSATDTDTPTPQFGLQVNKSGPASAAAGTSLSYDITIVNNGPSDVTGAAVADHLPTVLQNPIWTVTTAGSATASQASGNGDVSFTAGLPAGAANTITIHISGTIDPAAVGTLSNTASITPPGSALVFSNTVNTVLESSTGLTLVKQGPSTGHIAAGQPISYQLKLTNAGPSNAVGIVLSDVVPAAITNVSWVVSTAGAAEVAAGSANSGSGNNISTTVNIPAGLANVVTLQINGTVSSAATDTLLNTATATLPGNTTVTASNKTAVDNKPGLQIVKAGPATADAGTNITYTITVNNSGPSDALQAVISDVVGPTTMTNVSWTATAAGNAVINSGATGNGNTLSVNANIPAGSNNSVTIVVQGTILSGAAGSIRNTSTVAVTGQQPVVSNEVITQITNRTGLVVTKTGPVTGTAGGSMLYLLKITNTGPSDALNAVLLDTLGAMIQGPGITAIKHGNATVASYQITGNIAQVTGNIPAGDSNSIDVIILGKIDPAFTGQITNQGFISANNGPVVNSNVVITTVVNKPVVTITKAGKDTAVAGQPLNYAISVGNTGLSDAVNINIQDAVPAGLSNVSWTTSLVNGATVSSGATGTGSNINVTGTVPAGKQAFITVNVSGTITPSFTGDLSNFATATVNGGTPLPSDTVVTHVISKPSLQITKSGPGSVSAGGFIRYALQITNSGPSDAVNVNITDPVNGIIEATSWLTSVSGGASISSGATGNGNNVAMVANIPAGTGSIIVYVDGTVNAGAAGTVSNTATATVAGMPPVTASTSAVVINDPLISISKTGPTQANAGESISYTLVVTNYGKSNARNVNISDLVPPQLTNVSWSTTTAGTITVNSGATGTGNNVAVLADVNAGTQNHLFVTVTGTIAPDFTGTFINSSRAVVNNRDTTRSDTVTTTVASKPGIQIVKTAPDTVAAGGIITYTITTTNIGPSDAPQVAITDALPVFVKNVSWSATAVGNATVLTGGGTGNNVVVQGSIPAGANNMITLTITGTVDPAFTGDLNNLALATPGTQPSISSNTTVTHVVKKIALALSKSGPSQEAAGANIIYLLRLSNNGPSDAPGVQFFDTIPAAIKNVTWTAVKTGGAVVLTGATGTGNQVAVTGDIPAGAATSNILILVKGVIDPAYTGVPLRNIAYASSIDQPIPVKDTATTRVLTQSLLKFSKSGPTVLFAGDPVTYTIHLQNGGPSDAVNVHIGDVIDPAILNPAWTAVATGTGTSIDATSGTGNISLNGNIPAGAGHNIDITVTGILNSNYTGDSIFNSAVATLAGQQPVVSTVNTLVMRRANLRIVKSGPGTAAAGEKINYTITVNNYGPSDVTGLTITDIIPAAILQPVWTATAVGTGSTVSAASGTGNINLTGNLRAGAANSITITVNGTIDPSATDSSFIVNTATVVPPANFENTNPVNSTTVTLVRKQADLVIVKSGPANIAAGQNISYQLLVTNRGISDVTNAVISDAIPAGVAITNVTVTTTGSASAGTAVVNGNNITLTGNIVAGAGNSIVVNIDGIVDPAATGTITNTATVTPPADVQETNPANNTSAISTIISTSLGLQISKSGPASVNVLDKITYTIVLTNSGISDAGEVTVTDVVPTDITGVTWSATATGNAGVLSAASGSGNNINLTARVGGSNSGTITIIVTGTVRVLAAATITNTVTATANGSSSSTVVTSVNNSVDLRINKTAPTDIVAGEEITYVVTVTNAGPADAIGAAITDAMPAASDVQNVTWTATATGGANVTPTSGTGAAGIFLAADIPAYTGVVTITIKGTVNPATTGIIENAAATVPGFGQVDPTPAQVLVSTNVTTTPGLSVVKSGPAQVIAGDTMTYTLLIHNNGPSDATGVTIKDTIPGAVTGVTWSAAINNATITDPGTGAGNIVAITADIPAGGSVTVHIAGKTDPAFEGSMINHAVASGNGQTSVSNDVRTLVQNKPGLTIRKSGPAKAAAGAQISYAIAIANNGLSAANGITVADVLPVNLKNPVWSATAGGSAAIIGGDINNHPGDVSFKANVPAGSGNTIVVNISGTIDAAATGSLTNIANATLANGTPMADTVVTQLTTQTGLRLLKAAPDTATAGTTITYTVDVYNDGPSNAVNVNVADVIPAQLKDSKWSATAAGAAVVHGGNLQQQSGNVAFTADIPAGTSNVVHVMITGTVQSDYTGAVNNQATATAGGVNYLSNNVVTHVVSKPGLRLVKSGPSTGIAGDAISYSIILTNDGPSDAANIKIADILPAQILQPVWSAAATGAAVITGGNVTNQSGDVNLVASVPAGAGNRVVINVSGTIQPSFSGNITNLASYSLNGNSVNTPPVITAVTKQVKLKVSKSAPDTIAAGSKINYTLLITNEGLSDVNNVLISDLVPATIQQVSWNAVATGATVNGVNSGTGGNINVNASIPAGPQRNVLINISGVVTPSATGIIQNKVTISDNEKVVAGDSVNTHIINKPGVQFTKSGPRTAVAGSAINYTITLGNTGPSDLINAKVADLVPVQIGNVSWNITTKGTAALANGTPVSGTGNQITFTANVPAGTDNEVVVLVAGTVAPGFVGDITNTAQATDNGNAYTSSVKTTVQNSALLTIEKIGPDTVSAGNSISYVITAMNQGPSDASGISITDLVPAGITNVSWTVSPFGSAQITSPLSGTGNNITVNGNIPAGTANKIQIVVDGLIPPDAIAESVTNTATLRKPDNTTINSTVNTKIRQLTALTIRKVAPATANAGDSLRYNITIANDGPSDAKNIQITDLVSDTLSGVRWMATATGNAQIIGAAQGTGKNVSLRANIGANPADAIQVMVVGKINPDFVGRITNTATVADAAGKVSSAAASTAVGSKPSLHITKTSAGSVNAGDTIHYLITASNDGPSNAAGATITDNVPAVITNVSWTATANGASQVIGAASGTGNSISVKGNIAAGTGNTIVVNITGIVPANATATSLSNIAKLNDSIPSDSVITPVTKKPNVHVVKTAPATAIAGDSLKYTITVTNDGPSDASGVKISDIVSDTLSGVSWTASASGAAQIIGSNSGTGNVTLTGNISAGTGNAINIQIAGKINPDFTGTITNTAGATDANNNTTTGTATTQVTSKSALSITKTSSGSVNAGDTIRYVITASNAGPSGAKNVSIADAVPSAITNVTWTATANGTSQVIGTASGSGNTVLVKGNIDAGAGNTIVVNVMGVVPANATAASLTNIAILNDSIPSDSVITPVTKKPNVHVVKTAAATAIAGDSLKYTITVTNDGPSDASGVKISDIVSDTLSGVGWTASTSGAAQIIGSNSGTGNVTLTGNISAGTGNAINIQIAGKINPDFTGTITNTASATDVNNNTTTGTATTQVTSKSALSITKTSAGSVNAGDTIRYVITASNAGPSGAKNVSIADAVPSAITNVTWTATANGTSQVIGTSSGSGNSLLVKGNIDAGAGNTIVVNVMGVVPANATAASLTNIAILNDSIPSDSVITPVTKKPNVHVVKTAAATAIAGDSLRYTITVTNDGPSDASGVKISDIVSDTLVGVSWTASTSGAAQIIGSSSGTGNVTLTGNISAGTGNAINIQIAGKINPDFTGTITNTASATDANNNTTTGTATTQVTGKSALSITKTSSGSVNAGDTIRYVITASNAGPSGAKNVSIADAVPSAITNVTWTATANGTSQVISAASGSGNTVLVKGNIDAGAGNTIVVNVMGVVPANATAASLTNIAILNDSIPSDSVITPVTKKPNVHVVKAAAATAIAGDSLRYTITITNDGPSDASGMKISDIVSDTLSGVSWTASVSGAAQIIGSNSGTGNVTLTGNIAAGTGNAINIQIAGKINPDFTGTITNTASATDVNNNTTTGTATTQVTSKSALSITKTSAGSVNAGDTIRYVITASNAGPSGAKNVSIADAVPSAITNVTWTATANGTSQVIGTASGSGNSISVKGNIDAGAGNTIVVNVMGVVPANATAASLTNIAILNDSIPSDSVITPVTKKPHVHVVKTAAATAIAGDSLKYTITITNDGPSDASGVKISDIVSDTLSGVSWTASTTGAAQIIGGNSGTGNVTLTGNIAAGTGNAINIQIAGKINPDFTGTITNTASATDVNNNTTTGTAITQVTGKSALSITKTSSGSVNAGDTIRYVITASNAGPSGAKNVSIADAVPSAITNVTWTATANGTSQVIGTASGSGNAVLVKGNIDAGAGNTIVVNVMGVVPANATAASLTNIAILNDSIPSDSVITPVTKKPNVHVVKTAAATAIAGDSLKYTITVTNDGPSDASGVKISDIVSDTLSGVSWTASTSGAAQIIGSNSGTGNVTLTGNIAAGTGNAINIQIAGKINPDFTGTITNTASATDANNNTTTGTATTQVTGKSALSITKTSSGSVNAGDTIRYVITASNAGPSGAKNVSIADAVPSAITNVTWTATANGTSQVIGTASGSGNSISVKGNIDAGAGNTIVVNVMGVVPANATAASLTNIAILNDSIPSDSVITPVTKKPNVHVVKTAAATAIAGDSLKYTITITNDGPSDASGVKISDIVSDTLSGVSWTASTSGAAQIIGSNSGTGNVTLTGNIAAGTGNAIRILIAGKINPDFTGTITNTASATDVNNNTTTGTATTQVTGKSALSITKTGSTSVKAGEAIHYVVVAANAGPSTANGINITDLVPATITNVTWTAVANGTSQLTGPASGSGNNVSVKGNLAAGNSNTIQVNIDGIVPADATVTSVSNTATLNPGTGTPIPSEPAVTIVVPAVKTLDLSITKSGPASLFVNDSITYELTAQNAGPAAGDGAVITDILPVGIDGAYAVVTSLTGGAANVQLTNAGNVVKASIGTFPAGAVIRLMIRGKVTGTAALRNQAVIAAPDGLVDNNPENNTSATVITAINQVAMADLQVQKELLNTTPLQVGGKAEFAITLNNAGPVTTTGIIVRDTLNSNLEIVNGFDASTGTVNYDLNTRIIIWTLDSLRLTQTATLKYTARVTNTGVIANRATATAQVPDPNLTNNTASSKEMTVTGDDILIPNVITPNGDGKNDKFVIIGVTRYPNSSLFIYNRWGNMVFQSKNYQNEWDGKDLNEGTYYYILKLNTPNGERSYKGWIELLR